MQTLKKIAIAKTIYLAFAWTLITTLLPLVMNLKTLPVEHILFFINRFFFLYAICILFDYRDVEEDKNSGIKSLITYFTEKGIDKLFWASILLFLVSLFLLMDYFSPPVIIALFIPAFILSLLYYPCKKNFSDYLYYFILDGLMMLSLPLLLLIKFAR